MSALLEVSGISKSFDGFKAINNLSFSINAAELRAVIGPNGAGKTTFMDIVTGKTRPDTGEVLWGATSKSLLKLSEAQIAAVTKECLTGLHHLHTHGVIHRDIKSDNVLMSMNGNIKLSTSPPLTQPTLASVHRSARRTPSASPWSARRTGWRPRWSHGKSTAHASTSGAWAFCASRWSKASRRT